MDFRERVCAAIAERIEELGLTVPELAARAQVDATTVRSWVKGERWPRTTTRNKITAALGWDEADLARHGVDGDEKLLRTIPTASIIAELHRRTLDGEL